MTKQAQDPKQMQMPVGSLAYHYNTLVRVLEHHNDEVLVEGEGTIAGDSTWLTSLDKLERMSNSHYGITDKHEYFVFNDRLYRAPLANPIDANGCRLGAREVTKMSLLTSEYETMLGL